MVAAVLGPQTASEHHTNQTLQRLLQCLLFFTFLYFTVDWIRFGNGSFLPVDSSLTTLMQIPVISSLPPSLDCHTVFQEQLPPILEEEPPMKHSQLWAQYVTEGDVHFYMTRDSEKTTSSTTHSQTNVLPPWPETTPSTRSSTLVVLVWKGSSTENPTGSPCIPRMALWAATKGYSVAVLAPHPSQHYRLCQSLLLNPKNTQRLLHIYTSLQEENWTSTEFKDLILPFSSTTVRPLVSLASRVWWWKEEKEASETERMEMEGMLKMTHVRDNVDGWWNKK